MIITTHACERYLERCLGFVTWNSDDILRARKYLEAFIYNHKHKNLCKRKSEIMHVLVNKLILVFSKAKEVLITLYPFDEKKINYLNYKSMNNQSSKNEFKVLKGNKMTFIEKLIELGVSGAYPDPKLLSISISEAKKKIHITINDVENPYNLAGCFGSFEKAEKFIDDYTDFYNKLNLE